jgi:hypothetical protein
VEIACLVGLDGKFSPKLESSKADRTECPLRVDSVEKLTAFQKNPENGSVSANFYSSACGNRTLMADFSDINLSRRVFQQYRSIATFSQKVSWLAMPVKSCA